MDDHERTINKGRVSRVRALLGMKNSSLESRASLWDNSKSLAAHGARQQLQAELMTWDVLMCVQTSALPIHSFNSVHSQVHIHNSTLSTRRNTRQLAALHNVRRTVYCPRWGDENLGVWCLLQLNTYYKELLTSRRSAEVQWLSWTDETTNFNHYNWVLLISCYLMTDTKYTFDHLEG